MTKKLMLVLTMSAVIAGTATAGCNFVELVRSPDAVRVDKKVIDKINKVLPLVTTKSVVYPQR